VVDVNVAWWDCIFGMTSAPRIGPTDSDHGRRHGTRCVPHRELPQAMLPVAAAMWSTSLSGRNCRASALRVGHHYLGHIIEDYLGNGARLGVRIDYLKEETALGTAGRSPCSNHRPNCLSW